MQRWLFILKRGGEGEEGERENEGIKIMMSLPRVPDVEALSLLRQIVSGRRRRVFFLFFPPSQF